MLTYNLKGKDIKKKWYLVNAEDKTLGRVASKIAAVLRGKNKATYTPNLDCGDYVIVINAEKIKLTGKKLEDKIYYKHTGYIGGIKETKYKDLIAKKPEFVIQKAIKGMLGKGPLGYKQLSNLKVYAGNEYPHSAQKPEELNI